MTQSFDKSVSGYRYSGTGYVYTLRSDGKFAAVGIAIDDNPVGNSVILTGNTYISPKGNRMYQETTGGYIDLKESWTKQEQAVYFSQAQAQNYINKMIENNKQILQNNLLCARFSHKLSTQEKQLLYDLQERLAARNQQLLTDGLVTDARSSEAYGYQYLNNYLSSFMLQGRVGLVISTTTVIVISCVVIAALSTAAYFAYKYLYAESADDVKFSNDLTRTLVQKLTPEEYQQLMDETQGIVTRAKIKSRLGSGSNIIKWGLIGAGCYFLYKAIEPSIKSAYRHVVQ